MLPVCTSHAPRNRMQELPNKKKRNKVKSLIKDLPHASAMNYVVAAQRRAKATAVRARVHTQDIPEDQAMPHVEAHAACAFTHAFRGHKHIAIERDNQTREFFPVFYMRQEKDEAGSKESTCRSREKRIELVGIVRRQVAIC